MVSGSIWSHKILPSQKTALLSISLPAFSITFKLTPPGLCKEARMMVLVLVSSKPLSESSGNVDTMSPLEDRMNQNAAIHTICCLTVGGFPILAAPRWIKTPSMQVYYNLSQFTLLQNTPILFKLFLLQFSPLITFQAVAMNWNVIKNYYTRLIFIFHFSSHP